VPLAAAVSPADDERAGECPPAKGGLFTPLKGCSNPSNLEASVDAKPPGECWLSEARVSFTKTARARSWRLGLAMLLASVGCEVTFALSRLTLLSVDVVHSHSVTRRVLTGPRVSFFELVLHAHQANPSRLMQHVNGVYAQAFNRQ
jgi:hypothetical protein